jgi:hypothetical protein
MGAPSGNRATRAAQRQEAERQARIEATTARIDTLFGNPQRQRQYGDYLGSLRNVYQQDASRQKDMADRNLRFSLARSGLTGGAAAVDQGALLGDEYRRGLLRSEQQAQQGVAGLRAADETSRLNLLQMANAGTGLTSAATNAANAMRSNLATAQSAGTVNALGDIFGGTADILKKQREAALARKTWLTGMQPLYGSGGR